MASKEVRLTSASLKLSGSFTAYVRRVEDVKPHVVRVSVDNLMGVTLAAREMTVPELRKACAQDVAEDVLKRATHIVIVDELARVNTYHFNDVNALTNLIVWARGVDC